MDDNEKLKIITDLRSQLDGKYNLKDVLVVSEIGKATFVELIFDDVYIRCSLGSFELVYFYVFGNKKYCLYQRPAPWDATRSIVNTIVKNFSQLHLEAVLKIRNEIDREYKRYNNLTLINRIGGGKEQYKATLIELIKTHSTLVGIAK